MYLFSIVTFTNIFIGDSSSAYGFITYDGFIGLCGFFNFTIAFNTGFNFFYDFRTVFGTNC